MLSDATLVWSPETHKDSLLGDFQIESLEDMAITYSIKRLTPRNKEPEILLLKIQDGTVWMKTDEDTWEYLKCHVDFQDVSCIF